MWVPAGQERQIIPDSMLFPNYQSPLVRGGGGASTSFSWGGVGCLFHLEGGFQGLPAPAVKRRRFPRPRQGAGSGRQREEAGWSRNIAGPGGLGAELLRRAEVRGGRPS